MMRMMFETVWPPNDFKEVVERIKQQFGVMWKIDGVETTFYGANHPAIRQMVETLENLTVHPTVTADRGLLAEVHMALIDARAAFTPEPPAESAARP